MCLNFSLQLRLAVSDLISYGTVTSTENLCFEMTHNNRNTKNVKSETGSLTGKPNILLSRILGTVLSSDDMNHD